MQKLPDKNTQFPTEQEPSLSGSDLSVVDFYAGHTKHCECIKIAKSAEREYARITKLNDKLARVSRAAEKHIHTSDPCFICITLRVLYEL